MTWRKSLQAVVVVLAIPVVAFVGANAVDYCRFHGAIWRLEHLSEAQFRALGDAATKIKSYRDENPPGFEALQPISANANPGSSDFLLYELRPLEPKYDEDHIYLYVRIDTSKSNQQILYFTNSSGPQKSKVLWNRNPDFVSKFSPRGRILTIQQWTLGGGRKWIVLPDRILVVEDNGRVGGEPAILGSAPLDAKGRARIGGAIEGIASAALGKDYGLDAVSDGISLDISFEDDGRRGPKNVRLRNALDEEFRPLLTAISELSPKDCPFTYLEELDSSDFFRRYPISIRTLEEAEKRSAGEPNLPPWGMWRRWFD